MNRILRDEEAVSPVIATILMVAITVVLAATLYMMVGDFGGNTVSELYGSSRADYDESSGRVTIEMRSINSGVDPEDMDIRVIYDRREYFVDAEDVSWTGLVNGQVRSDSAARFFIIDAENSNGETLVVSETNLLERVDLRSDGTSGAIRAYF